MRDPEDVLSPLLAWGARIAVTVVAAGLLAGRSDLTELGLLLLMLTPVARVAVSAYAFARKGERKYAAVSAAVLALLLVGVFYGL